MWLRFNPASDALFLDIDGTLLDIAPTAEEVIVPPSLIKNLVQIQEKTGGALAFLSGRPITDIDPLFAPLRVPCAGVHGAEIRLSATGKIQHAPVLPDEFVARIKRKLKGMEGLLLENKGPTLAVHYRKNSSIFKTLEASLQQELLQSHLPLTLLKGRMVIEIVSDRFSKGGALERLMALPTFKGRRPFFLGDDITDLSAIGACLKHGGVAARVGGAIKDKSAFTSPQAVRDWLASMSRG